MASLTKTMTILRTEEYKLLIKGNSMHENRDKEVVQDLLPFVPGGETPATYIIDIATMRSHL